MRDDIKSMKRKLLCAASATLLTTGLAMNATAGSHGGDEQGWQGEMQDAWLDGKVETSITLNRYLNPFDIDTDVKMGVVTLTGTVESEVDRELAGEIAMGIDGVKEVDNRLTVEPDGSDTAMAESDRSRDEEGRDFSDRWDDATTTARVKYALLAHDGTDGLDINVDTVNGVVFLTGRVGSGDERELAGEIAGNTEGVSEVTNRLELDTSS